MARPKSKFSKLTFGNLGLETYEDNQLLETLKRKDIPLRQLLRNLVREWIKENKIR